MEHIHSRDMAFHTKEKKGFHPVISPKDSLLLDGMA